MLFKCIAANHLIDLNLDLKGIHLKKKKWKKNVNLMHLETNPVIPHYQAHFYVYKKKLENENAILRENDSYAIS